MIEIAHMQAIVISTADFNTRLIVFSFRPSSSDGRKDYSLDSTESAYQVEQVVPSTKTGGDISHSQFVWYKFLNS